MVRRTADHLRSGFLSCLYVGKVFDFSGRVFRMIAERITERNQEFRRQRKSLFNIRLPRVLGACIVGGGLAVSGCVYQGTMRNPMVSPDILGATAGAGMARRWRFCCHGLRRPCS